MTINKQEFKQMQEQLAKEDEKREEIIALSRKLLKISKKIIYNTHRDNHEESQELLPQAKELANTLQKAKEPRGQINAGIQEYIEALAYYTFTKDNKLITREETNASIDNYLLGLCDLTGELTRKAVVLAIDKKKQDIINIRSFLEELFGEFISFDFRNGELRKKTDQMRWNLQKVEELLAKMN